MYKIKIDMQDILEINEEKKIITVEPMVTIGKLNDFLIRYGWTLPVVPELGESNSISTFVPGSLTSET